MDAGGGIVEGERNVPARGGDADRWAYVRSDGVSRPRPPALRRPLLTMVPPSDRHPAVEVAASGLIDAILAFRTACAAHGADPADPVVAKALHEARGLVAFCDGRHGTA